MSKRIVVKIGTRALSDETGNINSVILSHVVDQIAQLKQKGIDVVLVTSGAVGAGRSILHIKTRDCVANKQVFASIGQVKLMSLYSDCFNKHGLLCAQILVTKDDFRDRHHYLNMKSCFENLLLDNIVPVVNENDVVATTELLFTDNDELAGLVASQLNANAVIILTSVDGVLCAENGNNKVVPEINLESYNEIKKYITPETSAFGRGGMLTKFAVAKKLASQGIATYIVNGKTKNILTKIIAGEAVGTKFVPAKKSSSLKRRLAYSEGLTKGSVSINQCAQEALLAKDKVISLLPIGITKVSGNFEKGDVIEIKNKKGVVLGFGVAQYDTRKAKSFIGKKNMKEIIHYNYMFIY